MLRWAFQLSLFAALLLAGLAGRAAWRVNAPLDGTESTQLGGTESTPPAEGLCIDRPARDLGDVAVGGDHVVEFVVANHSAAEHRILGVSGTCGWTCCFKPVDDVPVVIGAGQTYTLRCTLLIFKPGPFDGPLTVFVDQGGARPIRLTVRGIGTVSSLGPGHASDTRAATTPKP